tara:strand:- start:392 stop:553 length:162 start_codon:yes stop_codon:yes gene_type:complete
LRTFFFLPPKGKNFFISMRIGLKKTEYFTLAHTQQEKEEEEEKERDSARFYVR